MRVAFCLGGLEKGGAERVVCNLSNYLISQGIEVCILLTKLDSIQYSLDKKVEIIELDSRKYNTFAFRNFQIINKMRKELNSINPDIIISFLQEPTFRVLLLKKFNKKIKKMPLIVSLRNDPLNSFNGLRGKLLLKLYPSSDGFVFQTKKVQDFFEYKIKSKSVVIPNPLDPVFFCEKYEGKRENKIVSVGRLEEQKNYPLLLKAFSMFHKNNKNFHLHIYGDGTLKEKLKRIVSDYKLDNFVHFEGNVGNIKERIQNAKLFVISSNYEGLSNSLMEALALGLPCISTDSSGGGALSLIQNKKNGILVPVNDEIKLYEAMSRVVNDAKLSEKLANNAWSSMKKYSCDNINKKWLKYIKQIIESNN